MRRSIQAWLKWHQGNRAVQFVYQAWLDAGGEFAVVRRGAIAWLHENREREEAVYLTKFLAKEKDIPIETVRDTLVWCYRFPDNEDASDCTPMIGQIGSGESGGVTHCLPE